MVERTLLYPQHVSRLLAIRKKIYKVVGTLSCEGALSKEPIPKDKLDKATFTPFNKGMIWGGAFDCAWFKFKGQVPDECKGKKVVAILDVQGEGLVYIDGVPKQGITQVLDRIDVVQSRIGKQIVDLFNPAEGGEQVELLVDCGYNGKYYQDNTKVHLVRKDIAICDEEALTYYYDYLQLLMLMLTYGQNKHLAKERVKEIDKALNQSYKLAKKNMSEAHEYLAKIITTPIDYNATEYTAIGHAHIDLAWLWPIRETKRKGMRTFATAVNNIEKYPHYVFGASQAQLFDWVKQGEPELFEKVKKAVADGRIELQGGMWTECDCNIPNGESLIRQFMYGEKFFKDEFGKTCKMVWLPDVFGYPASLPQIMRKCGRDYFMTIKLSWNNTNKFPYKTFLWKGIDGTEVLSHLAPQGTYNSSATPMAVTNSQKNDTQADQIDKALLIYGIGDGGGGPGEAHIELVGREVNEKGLSKVVCRPAEQLFDDLKSQYIEVMPNYEGELYLEKHQGTYTSQAKNKLYNRLMEQSLHTLEWLMSVAKVKGVEYDCPLYEDIWKEVLLYQFHDIIPGSSIKRVYDESVPRYKEMYAQVGEYIDSILKSLTTSGGLGVVNPIGFDRKEYVKTDDKWYKADVKAYSSALLSEITSEDREELERGKDFIKNDKIKVHFAKDGSIDSLVDIASGKEFCGDYLNKLTVYSDPKSFYDAWDINMNYPNKRKWLFKLEGHSSYLDGASVIMKNIYTFKESTIIQKVTLTKGSDMVVFDTEVDWRETHKMLRADFRPSVYSDTVNCDIQFGNFDRSTLEDNSVNKAQFEICAHKFVNVDDDNYGVALLNNCKYGYRAKNGLLSLNLLRSPKHPDPECDMGEHKFTYAFYPHEGKWYDSDVVKLGYTLNNALIVKEKMPALDSLFEIEGDVILETVKVSEDSKSIVARIYERNGKDCKATIKATFPCKGVYESNMIENDPTPIKGNAFDFGKYEVKTLIFEI